MLRSTKTMLVCAALAFFALIGGDALAQQRRASDTQQLQAVRSALSTVMSTDQSQSSERSSNVETMGELSEAYGVGGGGNEPSLIPNCLYPVWAWGNFNGVWMMGWKCIAPVEEPIGFID